MHNLKNQSDQSAINEYFFTCRHYNHINDLFSIDNRDTYNQTFDICQARNHTIIIERSQNWNELLFNET